MSREELIQRVIEVLRADDRVRATWLSGSLGRGAGDRYSDVDLVAIVAEENRAGFVAEWDGIVATIASVVLANRLSFRSSTVFNQVTADWLRFDVSVITPASLDRYTASTVRPLFDKDDLYSRLRRKGEPLAPSGPRIQGLTEEFMRILGLLPVVLGREEYAVGASGSGLVRMLLIQLMTEDVAVEDRGGALHLRGLLPDAQLAAIDELPPILATRESAIAVHMAVARLFLPLARDLSKRTGTKWPDALESALRAHLDSQLGLKLPDLSLGDQRPPAALGPRRVRRDPHSSSITSPPPRVAARSVLPARTAGLLAAVNRAKRYADLRKRKSLTSGTVLGGRCKLDVNKVRCAPVSFRGAPASWCAAPAARSCRASVDYAS